MMQIPRAEVSPAPFLMFGLCNECQVVPILAGENDLKVCPKCYALLWHQDFTYAYRVKQLRERERESLRLAQLRKAKEEMRLRAKERGHEPRGMVGSGESAEPAGSGVHRERGPEVPGADDEPADGG